MAVTRLPTAALSLKQGPKSLGHLMGTKKNSCPHEVNPSALIVVEFLQRQNVLGIYRNMLRTIRQVPDPADQKYLRDWARDEFKRNINATDPDAIRMMITQANNHLEELQRSLALAR